MKFRTNKFSIFRNVIFQTKYHFWLTLRFLAGNFFVAGNVWRWAMLCEKTFSKEAFNKKTLN